MRVYLVESMVSMKSPFSLYKISGHSMEPTIKDGKVVLVWRWGNKFKRGDIVVFKPISHSGVVSESFGRDSRFRGNDNGEVFIKRVKFIRGEGFFLEGDNKEDSLDSRSLGLIKKEEILGKVIWVI